MNADKQYWDTRTEKLVKYRGEEFYTITPIPYYYERRKILLQRIKFFIIKMHAHNILDLGCGDGEYIYHLYEGDMKFHGVDISTEMIKLAEERCHDSAISFEVSRDGAHGQDNFDVAYIISVLAHVDDNEANILLESAYQSLQKGGDLYIRTGCAIIE